MRAIAELRRGIDDADARLLRALGERMALVRRIGRHKKAAAMAAVQPDRWRQVVEHRLALGRAAGLRDDFVLALLELIHREAVQMQDDILDPELEGAMSP